MWAYVAKKLMQLAVTTVGVVTLVFFTLRLIPGDAASAMAGDTMSGEALERLREQMGLNESLWVQYLTYWQKLLVLDFGQTITTGLSAASLMASAAPFTITIALLTIVLTVALAIPLGTLAAFMAHKGRQGLDSLITGATMVVDLMPSFWTGLVFLLLFSLTLQWFPASGTVSFEDPAAFLRRIALPVLVLAVTQVATMARITRTAVLEVLGEDYIRTARSLGWSELRVLFRHALKNASLPIVTVIGLSFGNLLNGTVIVEFIFNIPGIGSLLVSGINSRDYQMVQNLIIVYALIFVTINFVTDLAYRKLDPRVKF